MLSHTRIASGTQGLTARPWRLAKMLSHLGMSVPW
uniref:Uncharacterized protein n=1 Tax=Salmonella phage pJS4 TaxID=3141578 RepID=A0AAU7E4H9_9VIRU